MKIFLFIAFFVLITVNLSALTFYNDSIQEMIFNSDYVIRASVESIVNKRISKQVFNETVISFKVIRVFKGSYKKEQIQVTIPWEAMSKYGHEIINDLKESKEYFLFLIQTNQGSFIFSSKLKNEALIERNKSYKLRMNIYDYQKKKNLIVPVVVSEYDFTEIMDTFGGDDKLLELSKKEIIHISVLIQKLTTTVVVDQVDFDDVDLTKCLDVLVDYANSPPHLAALKIPKKYRLNYKLENIEKIDEHIFSLKKEKVTIQQLISDICRINHLKYKFQLNTLIIYKEK